MKVFLSSTLSDLAKERDEVLQTLGRMKLTTIAMENFLATPTTPLQTALENLRDSDLVILVIGNKAGSLLPGGADGTYTSAEYEEALKLGKEVLAFVRHAKRWPWNKKLTWWNAEVRPAKKKALDDFKAKVGNCSTWETFSTPDNLALRVRESIEAWDAKGRPGARRTFASVDEYFAGKNLASPSKFLDFSTTLLGRDAEIQALNGFLIDDSQRACVLSGRGGIGKSKILYDWAKLNLGKMIFLKDDPFWHMDSYKEIPVDADVIVVDDAHRQKLGNVLQIIHDQAPRRKLKLLVSTRPGSAIRLVQDIYRKLDVSEVIQLPELRALTREQCRALARQVLGNEFDVYVEPLAQIGHDSPMIIVTGGRFIANRKVDPGRLTNEEDFRSAIFTCFLEELALRGNNFAIDPPMRIVNLISALGPIDVDRTDFLTPARQLLNCTDDEILRTIDALAEHAVLTPRSQLVRVVPDVLSDYVLEQCCLGGNQSTHYADRIYDAFGTHSLVNLMRNLAELDWRVGRGGTVSLHLLDGIWANIYARFRATDEYSRNGLLKDLAGTAIYQPRQIMSLVRLAIEQPVVVDMTLEENAIRQGQGYVLSALPRLLEATAHHVEWLSESVATLWDIERRSTGKKYRDGSEAQTVLKRLAAWHRFGDASLNWRMLLQAISLSKLPGAFDGEFTPLNLVAQLLEREGEFTEWAEDESSMSFGGFGLNYAVVGPIRENALEYLETVLEEGGRPSYIAAAMLERLLHNYMNRVSRVSSDEEKEWQAKERQRAFDMLLSAFSQTQDSLLRARAFDAIRSGTEISCPEAIRTIATTALGELNVDDEILIYDAICTGDGHLPIANENYSASNWEIPLIEISNKGRAAVERTSNDTATQAREVSRRLRACTKAKLETTGFARLMSAFADRPEFLDEVVTQLRDFARQGEMAWYLGAPLHTLRQRHPERFRELAWEALAVVEDPLIIAIANNIRAFEALTAEDVALLDAYCRCSLSAAKIGVLRAITYMGVFVEFHAQMRDAVLAVDVDGDKGVAAQLADVFGMYGLPLAILNREQAGTLCQKFLEIENWDADQGAVPRFLNHFVTVFPDEVFDLLLGRLNKEAEARENRTYTFRTFDLVHRDVSFAAAPADRRLAVAQRCLPLVLEANEDSVRGYASLFWIVAEYEDATYQLIVKGIRNLNDNGIENLSRLINAATPQLAFTNPTFVRRILEQFHGNNRAKLVTEFADQARNMPSGGVFSGSSEDFFAQRNQRFANAVASFSNEPGLGDLAAALRQRT